MAYSQLMQVKLRVNNLIHDVTIPHYLIEDINNRGIRSSVIMSLDPKDSTSTVIGNFLHPVEILMTQPVNQPVTQETTAEAMDVQVSNFNVIISFNFFFTKQLIQCTYVLFL